MLSRQGLNIRRLMSQRRPQRPDGVDEDPADPFEAVVEEEKGQPWIASRKSTKKPTPKPIVVLGRSGSMHRISGPLPPLPDTPHSSASSLCSCEYHESASGRLPGNRSPGLCSLKSRTSHETSYSTATSPPRHDGRSPRRPTYRQSDSMNTRLEPVATRSSLQQLEALSSQPDSRANSPRLPGQATPRGPTPEGLRSPGLSRSIQQLALDMDEAFRAMDPALAEAEAPSHHLADICSPTFTRPRKPPSPFSPRTVSKKQSTAVLPTLKFPARSSSLSKPRTRRAKKSMPKKSMPKKSVPKKPVPKKQAAPDAEAAKKPSSRWTLADNVSELFNGRLFGRIEADEMLTPDQLQQMRQHRLAKLQLRHSSETVRPISTARTIEDCCDTPIEPFHLEGLPGRIGAAGVILDLPSPIDEVPTPRSSDFGSEVVRREGKDDAAQDRGTPRPAETDGSMIFGDVSFPSPPAKNPCRPAPRKQLPPLPTIPEVTVTGPDAAPAAPEATGFIFLSSTRFSMTAPTVQHGPIRFARADLFPEPAMLSPDETLDWTAFQMAIMGGAGDLFQDSVDIGHSTAADEAADLVEWFAELHVGHAGRLVCEPERTPPRLSPPSPPTPGYSPSLSASSKSASPVTQREMVQVQSLPIPVGSEFPSGFWNSGPPLDPGRFLAGQSLGIKRWTGEGHPRRYGKAGARESVGSLPQSPMLDLVVSRGADGAEYVVPMGYNLGHDLGDFLRWEAENVYASGIYD